MYTNGSCISACSSLETRLPQPLSSLYNAKNRLLPKEQLSDLVQHTTLTINDEEACYLERSTRGQASTSLWFEHRVGRITASVFGSVAKCREKSFPTSLVKTIMQYSGSNTDVPAIKWGAEHEQEAHEAYANIMAVKHATFKINPAGLRVCTKQPFLVATSDGAVSCSIVVKVCLRSNALSHIRIVTSQYRGRILLPPQSWQRSHTGKKNYYYYQVQGQMAIWKKPYCDFICWTTKGLTITRMQADGKFIREIFCKIHPARTVDMKP